MAFHQLEINRYDSSSHAIAHAIRRRNRDLECIMTVINELNATGDSGLPISVLEQRLAPPHDEKLIDSLEELLAYGVVMIVPRHNFVLCSDWKDRLEDMNIVIQTTP